MKNILRKTGKIIGIAFACIVAFLALLCIITLIWGAVQRSKGNVYNMLPETPSDFKPEIRLVVFTDTHKENENVADAIDTAYALFDNDEAYKGVDGFFCLGDISSIGGRKDYTAYKEALDGQWMYTKNFIDDYYVIDGDSTADFRIGSDTLETGESYTVTVHAESAYHLYSEPVELQFTAE